jgi:outer membrane protein TolC
MLSARENEEAIRYRQIFRIKEIYYRLSLMHERESVLQTGLNMAKSVESQAADYLEQGLINRADYLEAKVLLLNSEEQLLSVRNMIRATEEEMLIMLGEDTGQPVKLLTPLGALKPLRMEVGEDPVLNSGLQALSYRVDASENALKASKFQFIPTINLFGSYEFNDNRMFGLENENYTLGATLRWDLFKGFSQIGKVSQKKAEYRSAQIRYEQQYEEMQKEVRSRKRTIKEAEKRIELNRLASEQALEEFTIRKNRYEQGLETTSDLLKAETRYLSKELGLLQAIYDYRVNLASLEYLYETEF